MKAFSGTHFGMFAVSHILWSLVCSPVVMRLLGGNTVPAYVGVAAMMLAYVFWGWLCAYFGRWTTPDRSRKLWSVLLPAMIAWLWAGTTAFCLYVEEDGLIGIAAALGIPAFLLAAPSLLFVMVFMTGSGAIISALFGQDAFGIEFPLLIGTAILFAGVLPSLLFTGGSILGSKKVKGKKKPETA